MLPRLASEDPLTQLGGLAVTHRERWQCGQALGSSSLGGSTLSYPLELQTYWCELNLAVGSKIAVVRMLADINLAVQYGIAIHY